MNDIPVVDFAKCAIDKNDFDEQNSLTEIGKLMCDAFINCGFVYLKNTGISSASVDEVNETTRKFFESTEKEKMKYVRQTTNHGYDFIGSERLQEGQPGDYKMSYNMTCKAVEDENYLWPDDLVPGFSKVSIAFMSQCKTLALRIMDAISLGLQLKDPNFMSCCHSSLMKTNNNSSLRCLYYPPMPETIKQGQVRLAEHTDYGTLTLLFQDHIGGLQIKNRDGTYIDAHPIKDTVLVNVADLLQYWTGGVLKSTPHRIIGTSNAESRSSVRRSIAFFVHPTSDLPVSLDLIGGGRGTGSTLTDDANVDQHKSAEERAVFRSKALRDIQPAQLKRMTVGEYVNLHFSRNYQHKSAAASK